MSDILATDELPAAIRVPLHSLQADVDYLFARVTADKDCAPVMAESVKQRLANLEVAIRDAAPPASAKNETGIEPVSKNDLVRFSPSYRPEDPGMDRDPKGRFVEHAQVATQLAKITRQRDEALAKVATRPEAVDDEQVLNISAKIQNILAEVLTVDDGDIMMTGPASYKIARLFKPANPQAPGVEVSEENDDGR